MKSEIKIPSLGESITEASISAILKDSGSKVSMDEEIVELETDKVNQVLYSPMDGVLELSVNLDDIVQIGDVIGHVDPEGRGSVSQDTTVLPKDVEKEEISKEKKPIQDEELKEAKKETSPSISAKPLEEPKDESKITSSSGGGVRMMKKDFLLDLNSPKSSERDLGKPIGSQEEKRDFPEPPPLAVLVPEKGSRSEKRKKMSRMRKIIAKRLVEAQNTSAMLTTFNEVDMTSIMDLRKRYREDFEKKYRVKLGFMSFFVKAVVSALQKQPGINSYIEGEDIVERCYYDIGIAVSSSRGLVVPVIRNCEMLGFAMIENAISFFARKVRGGGLSVDELQGGGFTITNGGVFGSLVSTPILNPPQSAILGMHKIQDRPVAIDGKVEVRPMMYLALSYDHRVVDGKEAVTFLVHVKNIIENPSWFLLDI